MVILIGVIILALVGVFTRGFFINENVHLALRIYAGVVAVELTAGAVLLSIVIRDRIKQAKEENFKEVDR